MSSYDEHLITQAGGDGEPEPLDLDAIQARSDVANDYPGMVTIEQSQADVPALLTLVREQQAKLDAVEKLIVRPFASADKKHYEDDFNRGHVAGYNAAAHLLRKAIDDAKVKP